MLCEVSCQLDQLEKAGNTIYPIKKVPVRAAKSRPGQIDPYVFNILCISCIYKTNCFFLHLMLALLSLN